MSAAKGLGPQDWERIIDASMVTLEVARATVPALLASRAAKRVAFRELAGEVSTAIVEPTETEVEEQRARQRLHQGGE